MKKITTLLILSLLLSFFSFGQLSLKNNHSSSLNIQQEECKTDILLQRQLANDPTFAQKIANYKAISKQITGQKKGTIYTIPIVVHVIHLGEPIGTGSNISDAQIHSAINNLNEAYRNQAPYTGVDMELEFCLASVDPSNNPTSGINRVNGSATSDYATNGITNDVGSSQNEVAVKALSNWGNTDYYQFWIVAGIDGNMGGGGVQGYAYFSQAASKDGAVVLYNSFGYDPTGSLCYNLKSYTNRNVTTIHEIGHALGLYHTFQGDGSGSTCPSTNPSQGDEVADTPAHMRSGSGDACSSTAANTCDPTFGTGTQQDHIHNFMDYSGDACQTEFTSGQKTKARAWLLAARSSLTTSTKCNPVAAPTSEFTTQCGAQSGCAGSTIDFFDLSEGNPTSWSWSFPGGTPSSSSSQYPSITYNTPGTYAVTLTATNSFGTGNTETKSGFITIYNSPVASCTGQSSTNQGGFGYTISNVDFNTLSNSTSTSTNSEYTDFSCSHTTQVVAGNSYNLSITANAGSFGQGGTDFRVFIDWDGNGTYIASEEIPFTTNTVAEGNQVVSVESVTVPLTAQTGSLLRLRVISDAGVAPPSGACDINLHIGDVEDYGIYVNASGTPPVANFSGTPTTVCEGATVNFTDLSTNAPTAWSWSFPGGTPSTSTAQNPTITYNTAGTYNVTLTATNASGSDPETKTGYITVNGTPGNAGAISGSNSVCENATGIGYSISAVSGATNYNWTVPSGASITSGQGTTSITVSFGTNSGNVSVTPSNSCGNGGNSSFAVTVNSVPGNAGSISGTSSVCENATGIGYSISAVSGATNYNWTVPSGASITSGQGTTSITVSFGTNSGNVSVTPSNSCGNGGNSSFAVTVNSCAGAPVANFSGAPTTICEGSTVSFSDLSTNSPTSWSWSFPGGTPSTSTAQNPTVTYSTAGTYNVTLTATNASGSDPETKVGYITVNSASGPALDTTQIRPQDCGITLASATSEIYATHVPGNYFYQFRVTNPSLGFTYETPWWSSARWIALMNIPGVLANTTYNVEVRLRTSACDISYYGPSCQITTAGNSVPNTYVIPSLCGSTLSNINTAIYAKPISGASSYTFEIINTSLGFNRTITIGWRHINLKWWGNLIQPNSTYDIRVRATVNSVVGNYSTMCQITTPSTIRMGEPYTDEEIKNMMENSTLTDLVVYPNPNQGEFIYVDLDSYEASAQLFIIDISGKIIQQQEIDSSVNTIRFNEKLKAGFYFITVVSGDNKITKKLVVR